MVWIHLAATWALVGLIWTIQLVHYPLMVLIERGFANYAIQHQGRILWLVGPLMAAEAVTAGLLALEPPSGVSPALVWTGVALLAIAWLMTGLVSVPLHSSLAGGYDKRKIERLVTTNWVRTAAWTARGLIAIEIARSVS